MLTQLAGDTKILKGVIMTTTNKTLLAALMKNEEISTNPEMIEFITATLEAAGRKSGSKHPDILEDGIVIQKWCTRHEQYEDIQGWKGYEEYISDNKRIDASCDIAVAHWRGLTKELNVLEKQIPDTINDTEALQVLMMKIESLKSERAGRYEYPADGDLQKETAVEEAEVVAPKKPKRTKAKKA